MCSHLIPILAAKKQSAPAAERRQSQWKSKTFCKTAFSDENLQRIVVENTKKIHKYKKYKNTDTYFLPDSMRNSLPKYKTFKWFVNFNFGTIFGMLKYQILNKIFLNQDLWNGSLTGIAVNRNTDTLHDQY